MIKEMRETRKNVPLCKKTKGLQLKIYKKKESKNELLDVEKIKLVFLQNIPDDIF